MNQLAACLIATPLLLIGGLCHAESRLDLLPGGSVSGGMQMSVSAGASPVAVGAVVLDASTASQLAASGSHASSAAVGGGSATFQWLRSASLQSGGASAQWLLSGASSMHLAGITGLTEVYENSQVFLNADFLIADNLQAIGTPVRLTLDAASLFSSASSVPGLAAASHYELQVLRGLDVLAQLSSAHAGSGFNTSFLSTVGANLTLQISHLNTPYRLDSAIDAPAAGLNFQTADLFTGTLAVSAVPEPGTTALLLAGLAVVAGCSGAGRRRHSSSTRP